MEAIKRVFKLGHLSLECVQPELPPEESVLIYSTTYPMISTATISEGVIEDDPNDPTGQTKIISHTISTPNVKTKG